MSFSRIRTLVRDLMKVGVETCPPDAQVSDVARLMLEKNLESVVVLSQEDGNALGVVRREDLMRAYVREDVSKIRASEVMSEGVPQVPPDIPLTVAVQMMLDKKIRTFFLMHHAGGVAYPAASLSFQHVLRHLAATREEDLEGLGVEAARKSPIDAFLERRDAALQRVKSRRKE